MANFYCLVNKYWEKILFYAVIRRGKTPGFLLLLKRKKLT